MNRAEWTPAEGALLVNGVLPPDKRCLDVPLAANRLDAPTLPATQGQLQGATMVLRDYHDHVRTGDMPGSINVTPDAFLVWCKDSDQMPAWVPMLGEFLRHLYASGTNNTQTVDEELTLLRSMGENPGVASLQRKAGGRGKRSGLNQEITLAQAEARQKGLDASNPQVIWGILERMSREPESTSTPLRGCDRKGIQYVAGDGPKTYTYSALQKYLSR